MKKIIFFLILTFITAINLPVNAKSTSFYEGEYISGIWMDKYKNGTTYHQQARFFRETGTNNFAYCIQPFIGFEGGTYNESTPTYLTSEQLENITLIAHFGYGYMNHTEPRWYAITQFMIWQIADPTGYYYFTNSFKGDKIDIFQSEMGEIYSLVNAYKRIPEIAYKNYTAVEGKEFTITDKSNTINAYKIDNFAKARIKDNQVTIYNLEAGSYTINFSRTDTYHNKPILFYQSNNSQDLIETGDPIKKNISININVIKTSLTIDKIDKDTKSYISSGEGSLIGTTYQLYDSSMKEISTLTIDETSKTKINNLSFGKYYLKEIKAGEGYIIDDKIYEFMISEKTPHIKLTLENEIIKSKLIINKVYGIDDNYKPEKNINFNIYDKNNNLIQTIITDENGHIETILPYGKYKLIQLTSTEGYQKVEPITFEIKNNEDITFNLIDYEIPVPDTKSYSLVEKIISFIKRFLCIKKQY